MQLIFLGFWVRKMSRQVLLCVESNIRSKTDYIYINATIKRFYRDDKKIVYRPVFLGSKSNYNDKSKVKEINKRVKDFPGQTNVIYFIDVDDADISAETKRLNEEIKDYCRRNSYDYVFFVEDIEDVYLYTKISSSDKVKKAEEFSRKKMIETIKEERLRSLSERRHCSNILTVLDKYWTKK